MIRMGVGIQNELEGAPLFLQEAVHFASRRFVIAAIQKDGGGRGTVESQIYRSGDVVALSPEMPQFQLGGHGTLLSFRKCVQAAGGESIFFNYTWNLRKKRRKRAKPLFLLDDPTWGQLVLAERERDEYTVQYLRKRLFQENSNNNTLCSSRIQNRNGIVRKERSYAYYLAPGSSGASLSSNQNGHSG
jgi:hypothetical protein